MLDFYNDVGILVEVGYYGEFGSGQVDLVCLEVAMAGSIGILTGRGAVILCLWWRLGFCPTYLFFEVGLYWAWALIVPGGLFCACVCVC